MRVDRRRARRAADRRRDDHRPRPHRASAGGSSTPASGPTSSRSARRSAAASRCRALLTTDEICGGASRGANPSGSSSSYGGNPLGAAAGAAALRDHRRGEAGRERARVGEVLLRELRGVRRALPVRRASSTAPGLLLRMELVKDKKTKEPLPRRVTERIFTEAVRRGPADDGLRRQLPDPARADHRRGDGARTASRSCARCSTSWSASGSGKLSGARAAARPPLRRPGLARRSPRTSWRSGSAAATSPSRPDWRARWARSRSIC